MSDLSPEDEDLLERARGGNLASEDDHARVKRKLLARIGMGLAVGTTTTSAASGAGAGLSAGGTAVATGGVLAVVAKVVAAVALVGGATGTGYVLVHKGSSHEASARAAPVATPPELGTSMSAAPASAEGVVAPPTAHLTSASVASDAPPSPTVNSPAASPVPAVPLPSRPTSAPRSLSRAAPDFAPLRATPASSTLVGPPSDWTAVAPAPQAPAGPATVAAEAELLRQADAARKGGDAARALALVDEHRARFPDGILVQEREAERVVVLCALGRAGDARAAAAVFLSNWPRSPLAGRVREACADR